MPNHPFPLAQGKWNKDGKEKSWEKKRKKEEKIKEIFFSSFNAYDDIKKQREKENEYVALIE